MKKIKGFFKKNYKFMIGVILGLTLANPIVQAANYLFASNDVSYDNSSSGLASNNVKDALDELYTKASASANKIVYTHSTEKVSLYGPIPDGIEQTEDIDSSSKVSIRHTLVNNIVMENDIEFELSSKRYVLKGGNIESNFENNKTIAKNAFGDSNCSGTTIFSCMLNGYWVYMTSETVRYQNGSTCKECQITSDGDASCFWIRGCATAPDVPDVE